MTKKKYLKKIIWRTWGHDIRPFDYSHSNWIIKLAKKAVWSIYEKKVQHIHAIGIANDVDRVNVEDCFGEISTCLVDYTYNPGQAERLEEIRQNSLQKKSSNKNLRILVGHSASTIDNHIQALRHLEKYAKENIVICLILSYGGSKEYIDSVKKYAFEIFGETKVEIIDSFMQYYEFAEYLATIDVAILNQFYSSALGILNLILYFDKILYVNPTGQLIKSFKRNSCACHTIDELDNMVYENFAANKNDVSLRTTYGQVFSSDEVCKRFRLVLDNLSN